MSDFERINAGKMTKIELDANAIDILNWLIKRETLDSPSDAIRFWDNERLIQSAVIHKQTNEIDKLKCENERLKGIMKTAGIV